MYMYEFVLPSNGRLHFLFQLPLARWKILNADFSSDLLTPPMNSLQELFLRDRPDLSGAMSRVDVKETFRKGANNPDQEPNLYAFPRLHHMGAMRSVENPLEATTPPNAHVQQARTPEPTIRKYPVEESCQIAPESVHIEPGTEGQMHTDEDLRLLLNSTL